MKRWFLRLLAAVTFLMVAVVLVVWLGLRASLPQLDGVVVLDGLQAAATIERDIAGIPTIIANNRADLAFATGFAHGQDRFFQMDLIRRQAAGELSEIIGSATLKRDKFYRWHRFRARAQMAVSLLPDDDVAILNRYAAGVNAGLASLRAKPFEYFLLSTEPADWLPEDSILVVYSMFVELNDSQARKEVQRGLAHRVLSPEVYAWMYPQGSPWDAPLMGEARPVMPIPPADAFNIGQIDATPPAVSEHGKEPLNGSNNWAVSGALTESGRAMVANDMHLGLSTPNIYYRARLIVDGDEPRDVTGVTLPGTPSIVAGSNGSVAWGFTNSYGDWVDAVVLRPGLTPDTYKTPEGDQPFKHFIETIRVKHADAVDYPVRETIWGPVREGIDYPDGEIAVRWIAHDPDGVNPNSIDLETAASVASALDIANKLKIPPQNFVVAGANGDIGWTIAGRIPVKTTFDAMLPADWSAEHGWVGWLDAQDYPRIVNPDDGRIWSANARVVDGPYLQIIGDGGYDLGARAKQIRDGLFAQDHFSATDMLAIQLDDRALFLDRWQRLLLTVLDSETVAADADLAEYRRLVAGWIPQAVPESVGYRLVRGFRLQVRSRVFHALTGPLREAYGSDVSLRLSNQFEAPLWSLLSEQPDYLLPVGVESWHELMVAAVRDHILYLSNAHVGPLADRSWGEWNQARIQHPLSRAVPALAGFLDMPIEALSGDINMPRAQAPDFGASERFAVSPGDEANGLMQMPTGQSGHPLSDFYREGHEDWVRGRPAPFLPGETRYSLTLQPAS